MTEIQGLKYLKQKLAARAPGVDMRQKHYDLKGAGISFGVTIPREMRYMYRATLGWCAKAVDSMADRLIFREFTEDTFDLNGIYAQNNPDTLFDSAILSALVSACSFIYIQPIAGEIPRMWVLHGRDATGEIDEATGLLTEGYAVLSRDPTGNPVDEAYFAPGITYFYKNGKANGEARTEAPAPLLVPVIHRPDAMRPFGRPRITRSAIYYQQYAKRTLERADVTAEFYAFPQKYVVGLSPDAEPMEAWKATISAMLQFTKDEQGDSPKLGQFTQPSMSPFTEQLRTAAACFAGETGLTLDDLGFTTDNPSSAEAIKASHETLRVAARKAQRNFGVGFLNAGYLAACVRDNFGYSRSQLYRTRPTWEPVFESDASTLTLVGDAAIKLNQAIPGFVDSAAIRDLTGVKGAADG